MKFLMAIFFALSAVAAEPPVLFIGDSVTFGVREGVTLDDTFVRKCGGVNAGVSGNTSRDGLSRLPTLLQQYAPRKVFIMFGLNDALNYGAGCSVHEYKQNLAAMVDLCRSRGATPILFTCNPLSGSFANRNIELFGYVAAVRALGTEKGVQVCDVFQSYAEYALTTNGPAALLTDGQHPNVLGHWLIVMVCGPLVNP